MPMRNLEGEILAQLYDEWHHNREPAPLLFAHGSATPNEVNEALRRLEEDGAIEAPGLADSYSILPPGIVRAEEDGLAAAECTAQNNSLRSEILLALFAEHEENGPGSDMFLDEFVQTSSADRNEVLKQLDYLEARALVEPTGVGVYSISRHGVDLVRSHSKKQTLFNRLSEIEALAPQPRGRALQLLLGDAINADRSDWKAESSVWTSGDVGPREDADVVIQKELTYFNLEAKWEAKPIGADPIGKLYAKLGSRAHQFGIVASMSGFNVNARKKVAVLMGQKVILLFGRKSIEAIIAGTTHFEELVNEKYRALVVKQDILDD